MIVVWRVTQRCNLSCPFCAYDRKSSWRRRDADAAVVRRFGAVLADYQRATGDPVLVSWIGGEPFLFPPLSELSVWFTKGLGLSVSATTNGTTLSAGASRAHIFAHYSELTISVDGIGLVHDGLRGWRGGYAALREAVMQLAEMKLTNPSGGPRLRANVVLMRDTIANFEALCMELAGWGITEITFNQLGGRDRPEFFPAHRLLADDAAWLKSEMPRLRARLEELGVQLKGGDNYLRRIQASSRDEDIAVKDCSPGESFLFINEAAIASPCNFTSKGYGVSLDELNSVEALCDLPKRFARARLKERLTPCEDCQSTQVFEKFMAQTV